MAPINVVKHFQYLVVGGGSGGIASARRAAEFGVSVGLIEKQALGGTCVSIFYFTMKYLLEDIFSVKNYQFVTILKVAIFAHVKSDINWKTKSVLMSMNVLVTLVETILLVPKMQIV